MTPTEATKLLDHAAVQSDRWLMLVLLMILLAGGFWLIRMVLGSMMKQMVTIVDRIEGNQEKLLTVVDANTRAWTSQGEIMRNQGEAFRDLERAISKCSNQRS